MTSAESSSLQSIRKTFLNCARSHFMQYAPHICIAAGTLALVFAYWGMKTDQGRRTFDEMAGMIPLGVGAIGFVLMLIGAIWLFIRARSQ